MRNLTAREFIELMYHDNCDYYGPQPMTIEDARYNLREYSADGIPVPPAVTPLLYTRYWNLLYMHDTNRKEA